MDRYQRCRTDVTGPFGFSEERQVGRDMALRVGTGQLRTPKQDSSQGARQDRQKHKISFASAVQRSGSPAMHDTAKTKDVTETLT